MLLSVLAAGSEGVLYAQEWRAPGRGSKYLAPAVHSALEFLGLKAGELGGLAMVRGPGSFTGLRMTMAFGLGLARSAGLPMAGIDYLPLLASGPAPLLNGILGVVVHSRMREIYFQAFACPESTPLGEPLPVRLDDLPEIIDDQSGPVRLMGSGLRRNSEFFARHLSGIPILPQSWDEPSSELLGRAALQAQFSATPPEPLYLRPSDAEENLTGIAASRGLDPKEAMRRLRQAAGKNPGN